MLNRTNCHSTQKCWIDSKTNNWYSAFRFMVMVLYTSSSNRAENNLSSLCSLSAVESCGRLLWLNQSLSSVSDLSSFKVSASFCLSSRWMASRSSALEEICSSSDSCDTRARSWHSSIPSWETWMRKPLTSSQQNETKHSNVISSIASFCWISPSPNRSNNLDRLQCKTTSLSLVESLGSITHG